MDGPLELGLVTAKVCPSCFFSADCSSVHMKILINEKKWLYHPQHTAEVIWLVFFLLWMLAKRWAYHVKRPFKISSITTIGPHLKKTWHNKNKQQISLQLLHLILSELSLIYFIKRSPDSLSKCEQIQCGKLGDIFVRLVVLFLFKILNMCQNIIKFLLVECNLMILMIDK